MIPSLRIRPRLRSIWVPLLAAVAVAAPVAAQQARQVIISVSERKYKDATDHLSSAAQVVPLSVDLRAFRAAAPNGELRLAAVPLSRGIAVDLDLEEFNVIAPDAVMTTTTAQGELPLPRPTARLFRGKVAGQEKSFAYLSISDNSVVGSVMTGGKTYQISTDYSVPASATRLEANAYPLADAKIPDGSCGLNADNIKSLNPYPLTMEQIEQMSQAPSPAVDEILYSVKGAFDADYEYVQLFGGNRQAAEDYMVQLIGQVSAIFERDVSCQIVIGWLHMYETTTQPYMEATSMDAALYQESGYWNQNTDMQKVDRAFTHVFSGKPWQNPIGIAFLDILCTKGGAFAYSAITKTNPERDVEVVAHENGHIFGSRHTHSCTWNPEIDRCAAADDGACFGAAQVTQSVGTIMSYCAQKELVFHEKCANFIKNNLLNKYKCVEFSARLTVNPTRIYFPNVLVGQARDTTLEAFYQNNSRRPVQVLTQTITGTNTAALTVVSPEVPFTLQPGESKALKLHLLSTEEKPTIANMRITHDALNAPVNVVIEGYALDKQPILGIIAGGKKEVDFKTHRVGDVVDTAMKNVFANNGEAPLRATKTEIVGPDRFDFQILEGTAPFQIETGAPRVSAKFRFAPQTTGPKEAWLRIESNSKNGADSIHLVGNVKVGPLLRYKTNERSVNFHERERKKSYDSTIDNFFTNVGSDTVEVVGDLEGENKGSFTVNIGLTDLAPGESYNLPVTLFDTTVGLKKAYLVINQIETEGFTIFRRDTINLVALIVGPAGVPDGAEAVTGFTISPNPTSGDASIAIAPLAGEAGLRYTVSVTDVSGREVRRFEDRFSADGATMTLKTDGLAAGTYFLTLRSQKGQRVQTLTVTR